jgi:hypothetical protein
MFKYLMIVPCVLRRRKSDPRLSSFPSGTTELHALKSRRRLAACRSLPMPGHQDVAAVPLNVALVPVNSAQL